MKKLLLLLSLFTFCQLGAAQTQAPQQSGSKTSTQAAKQKATAAKPAAVQKAAKLIWRTPATQEALALYTSLQFPEAYARFREAAAQGDPDALYFIGRMHQYRELKYDSVQLDTLQELQDASRFFAANNDSARYYYQKAVDENSLLGHLGLGEMMILRTQEDKQRFLQHMRTAAIEIREKAVEGDAFSNRILGSMYYTGYGELKDREMAVNYLSRAAGKDDAVANTYLANMYLEGEGVKKDYDKAVALLKKSAAAGDREALYTLGLLLEEGTVGEPNIQEARVLYRKAISKGSVNAYEQLKYINQTPDQKLVIAAVTRDPAMLKRALTAGADANTLAIPDDFGASFNGRTPLMHTVYIPMLLEDFGVIYEPEVRLQMASQLLRKGADINAQDEDGKTALHYAVSSSRVRSELYEAEQVQLLDTLLQHGANPNLKDKDGNTVLHQALQATIGQHIGIMELEKLLAAGADPNSQNSEGKTPLMVACEMNANYEIILALLQAGTDVKLRDTAGKAAIDYTKHENVVNILMAAGSPQRQE